MSQSKLPETSLEEILTVTPVPGSDALYTAKITKDWCGVWAAFGGTTAALIHSTTRLYSLNHHPKHPQPDPLNSHVQYLYPIPPGPIRLSVLPLKIGSRVSILQVSVQILVPETGAWKTCVLGIITQGNLATERGLTIPLELPFPKTEIPERERDCVLGEHPKWYSDIALVIKKFEMWMPKFGDEERVESYGNPRFGRETREMWVKRKDGKNWDVLSLGLVCDYFEGAPGNFSPSRLDAKSDIWYATLSLATEIKANPEGKKWLYFRARANVIKNGRFDTLVWVLDEEGSLMAIVKEVTLVTEGRFKGKLEELRGAYKL